MEQKTHLDSIQALGSILKNAIDCSKQAKKFRKSLKGDNFYANKFNTLKAESTRLFSELKFDNLQDSISIVEIIDIIFKLETEVTRRVELLREFDFRIKTINVKPNKSLSSSHSYLPISLLNDTKRGYLQKMGVEINTTYEAHCYTSCLVMMRRLLEISIIEVYEGNKISDKIKDDTGNYFMLERLVDLILNEKSWSLSRTTKEHLPYFRVLGNLSAHGKFFHAKREDLDKYAINFRSVIEELLRHAKLL